jgi:hypothetical protein
MTCASDDAVVLKSLGRAAVGVGLGPIDALRYCSITLYQIH